MNKPLNVLFCMPPGSKRDLLWSAQSQQRARELGYNIQLIPSAVEKITPDQWSRMLQGVEAVITSWGAPKFDETMLKRCPDLKIIGHAAGSVAEYVTPEVFKRGIKVINANSEMSRSVAEWCLTMTLVGHRRLLEYSQFGQYGRIEWERRYLIRGFQNAVIGIWGYGDVVRHLLPMLQTLKPKEILVESSYLTQEEADARHVKKVELDEIFSRADIIHTLEGLTPSSKERIGPAQLAAIKDGAVLCNAGRAHLFQQDALMDELKKNRFSAVLDVFFSEPLPPENPFCGMPNVILTPHNAGYGRHDIYVKCVLDQFDRFFRGESLSEEITLNRIAGMTQESIGVHAHLRL